MSCSDEKKLVRLSAYAEHYGCSQQGIKRRCQNGEMKTARKIGKIWMIDINEEPPADRRLINGFLLIGEKNN